ncbi:MAG: SPFH domain-containing protein [Pseudomonadota bacterium]
MSSAADEQQQSQVQDQALARSLRTALRFVIVLMVALLAVWVGSGVVSVPADRQAVVIAFGDAQVKASEGGGLVWWWPSPIGEVRLIPAASRKFSLDIKDLEAEGLDFDPRDDGGYVLTGDHGAIHMGATVFWRVRDPIAYAFLADPEQTRRTREIDTFPKIEQAIRRAFQRAAIHTCAQEDLNTIRITGKDRIRRQMVGNMNALLSSSGTMPFAVAIDNVEFSTSLSVWAQEAFDSAQQAQSEADQLIAEAESQRAVTLAVAQENAAQIVGSAKAVANELTSLAIVRTRPIAALAKADSADRRIVLYRLWRDTVDRLFQQAHTTMIVPDHKNLRVLLPTASPVVADGPAASGHGKAADASLQAKAKQNQ